MYKVSEREGKKGRKLNTQIDFVSTNVYPRIIYEDNFLFVFDKPSGWIVNKAATIKGQKTFQEFLEENFDYPLAKRGDLRSGIIHRLDKETSGVILVAKKEDVFLKLQTQFKERMVKKVYLALVHGRLEPSFGSIEAPVARLPWNKERFGVVLGGKEAKTDYKVKDYLKKGKDYFSLVFLYPKTGRTHQIRVHLKFIGHPVVGDTFYAGRKVARKDREWCPRLFLHAYKISFFHPGKMKEVSFESQLPTELKKILSFLERQ